MARLYWILLIGALTGQTLFAGTLDICLAQIKRHDHRLSKIEAIESCFEKNKHLVSGEGCFAAVKKATAVEQSLNLQEKLNGICFYESSHFKNVSECLNKSSVFQTAENHDEGVFECYRQFQSKISTKQCLQASEYLKYPAKKEYLKNHCYVNSAN
jgi:hypothetical protein